MIAKESRTDKPNLSNLSFLVLLSPQIFGFAFRYEGQGESYRLLIFNLANAKH
jgi:hypothetical protein